MVGCRNQDYLCKLWAKESIKHSDGGVSEHVPRLFGEPVGVYQAFRWWGVGTDKRVELRGRWSLSSIPMVGCRNWRCAWPHLLDESIKHSDGGVSERSHDAGAPPFRVYQAFRWWGVGTTNNSGQIEVMSLSSIPMVGCRNVTDGFKDVFHESIKHSDGGVSEP